MPGGLQTWTFKPRWSTYRSPYGPKYSVPRNWHGITVTTVRRAAVTGGGFAMAAGIFALYFFEGVPRVQNDILQKVPVLGEYWMDRGLPDSDNPF